MATIKMPRSVWDRVHRHLYGTPGEHFAFLFAAWGTSEDGPVFLVHDAYLVPEMLTRTRSYAYELSIDAYLPAINRAIETHSALIELHNHGGENPRFSTTDLRALPEFVAYALSSLPNRPYAATVWGDDTVHGKWFERQTGGDIRSMTVFEAPLTQLAYHDQQTGSDSLRYDRQLPWFTAEGQANLAQLRVAVVGLGGTGSHVAQQLTFLGIRDFVLADDDSVDATNLNRLVTATPADIGTPKTMVARRLIRSVASDARVTVVPMGIPSADAISALKEVDVIVGCVDDDGPRFVLNAIAVAFGVPYFDVAVGIEADGGRLVEAGGRLALVRPGGPCLQCMKELDLAEVQHWLRSPQERAFAEERGYVRGQRIHSPAVVSLNGLVASLAVNEFAMLASGTRPVPAYTEIDLLSTGKSIPGQWTAIRRVSRDPQCLECENALAGDRADVDRFSRHALRP